MSDPAWHGARRGVRWTAVAAGATALLQALQIVVLARLLAPSEFGLYATVAVLTGMAAFVAEAGLGPALVRRNELGPRLQGTAHAMSLGLGLGCAALLWALSEPLAAWYRSPPLAPLVRAAAAIFVVQPLGLVFAHLLQRDLSFKALAGVEIGSGVAGTGVALAAAGLGWGAASLVAGQIAAAAARSALLLALGLPRYGLHLGYDAAEGRYLWRMGLFQIGDNLLNYLNAQLDLLLLGRLAGPQSLGLYYAAKQIAYKPLQLINPVVTKVALPVLSRLQDDPARLKRGYLGVVGALALVQVPVFGALAALSPLAVALLLGPGWDGAVPVLALLALSMLLRATISPVGSLLLARGRADRSLAWNAGVFLVTAVALGIGTRWGAPGVAAATLVVIALLHLPAWALLVRPHCGAGAREYYAPQAACWLAAALCLAPAGALPGTWPKLSAALLGLAAYAWWFRRELGRLLHRPPLDGAVR